MFHTGIIRRVDDLGRIVIPKEIRNRTGIKEFYQTRKICSGRPDFGYYQNIGTTV